MGLGALPVTRDGHVREGLLIPTQKIPVIEIGNTKSRDVRWGGQNKPY